VRARFRFRRSSCAHALAGACLWLLRAAVRQNDLSRRCFGFAAPRPAPARVCFGGVGVLYFQDAIVGAGAELQFVHRILSSSSVASSSAQKAFNSRVPIRALQVTLHFPANRSCWRCPALTTRSRIYAEVSPVRSAKLDRRHFHVNVDPVQQWAGNATRGSPRDSRLLSPCRR